MATQNQTASNETAELRVLRRRRVEALTGLSRSSIYAGVNAGTFPKPIQLGAQSVGWLASEIDAWLRDRIAVSRGIEANIKKSQATVAAFGASADEAAARVTSLTKTAAFVK